MEDFWPMSHFLQQINVKISVLFKYHQKFGQKIVAIRFKSPNLVTIDLYAFIISTKCTPTITHSPFDGNIYLLYRFTKQF